MCEKNINFFKDDSETSLSGVENKGMKVTADQPISVQISIPSGPKGENNFVFQNFLMLVQKTVFNVSNSIYTNQHLFEFTEDLIVNCIQCLLKLNYN